MTTFCLIAGPCTVESREQTLAVGAHGGGRRRHDAARRRVQAAHVAVRVPGPRRATALEISPRRAPRRACRSSPRSWTTEHVAMIAEYADMLQIGARNMQNFALLQEVGSSASRCCSSAACRRHVEELLMAAEYILARATSRSSSASAASARSRRRPQHARPVRRCRCCSSAHAPAGHRRSRPRHGRPPRSSPARARGRRGRRRRIIVEVHRIPTRRCATGRRRSTRGVRGVRGARRRPRGAHRPHPRP